MESSKQIKIGAIISYISIGLNIIAGLVYTPWMINQIGKSQYGLFTLSHSLITLFLVDFGLSSATARFVSKYKAEGKQDQVNNFLGAVYRLYLFIDIVIFLVLVIVYLFIDEIYVNLLPSELLIFKTVYAISAIFSVINFPFVTLNGVLTAYEKFIQLKLVDVIYRILVIVMTVIALLLNMGIYALVTVNAISGLIITLYKLIVIKKTTPVKVNFRYFDKSLYKSIFSFSIWVSISVVAQRLIFNITPTILGIVANSSAIALFGIVVTIESYTYTITSAINGLFMPRIFKIYNQENSLDNLLNYMIKIGKFQYALNGLIIAGFAIVGRQFIELWVGKEYLEAYPGILLVIIPGLFFNSLEIASTAMIVQNKVNIQAYITTGIGIVNICLSPILSMKFGVIGACVSIFIAYTLRAIICNIVYYKVLKINIIVFIKECYIGMMFPIILTIIIGVIMNKFFVDVDWINLIIESIIIVLAYMILLVLLGLSKEEKDKIKNILKKN